MATFCERLTEERKRLNLKQVEFANLCGVGRATQIRYEAGENKPDSDYLAKIATLGVDVGYVLTRIRSLTTLSSEEQVLVDHYRNSSEQGKRALRETGLALTQRDLDTKSA